MTKKTYIFLIPGFFGFQNIGSFRYFFRVKEALEEYFEDQLGEKPIIVQCTTQPTSSLKRRATAILDEVKAAGATDADAIHLVGHSTGGLDARLIATPDVRLRKDRLEATIGDKIKSITTISTPHFGTPLASFLNTIQGRHILQLLTTLAINKAGRGTIFLTAQALSLISRLDDWTGRRNSLLDVLSEKIFDRISFSANDPIWAFLNEIKSDQGAVIQLTPEGMHLYNASVTDRPGVNYNCVVTAVRQPSLTKIMLKLRNPAASGSALLFYFLHYLATNEHKHYPYPSPAEEVIKSSQFDLPFTIDPATNDGVCPAMSQIYGNVLAAIEADHMDIVGQFYGAGDNQYSDWLSSGARFNESQFQSTWRKVADSIITAEKSEPLL